MVFMLMAITCAVYHKHSLDEHVAKSLTHAVKSICVDVEWSSHGPKQIPVAGWW